jgi:hypothetical protein
MNTACPTSQEVAQWIVSYLARYPDAADTAAGIQRWWLAPYFGDAPLDVVQQALVQLERQGVVVQLVPPGAPQAIFARGASFPPP